MLLHVEWASSQQLCVQSRAIDNWAHHVADRAGYTYGDKHQSQLLLDGREYVARRGA